MEKSILVSLIAVIAVLALLSAVSADVDIGELTNAIGVTINGVEYVNPDTDVIGIEAGETIPIKAVFRAAEDASDVVVKAFIDGYRSDITSKTGRFELVNDSVYTKYLSLKVPSDIDPTEDYTLTIRISNKDKSDELEFKLKLQRESYKVEVLSAEVPDKATPGSSIPVDIVLKNWGMHKLEDIFVKVRISDLGIEKKVYFDDLNPLDEDEIEETEDEVREADRHDSVERRVYISIPEKVKSGVYNMEIEAYNLDSAHIIKKSIVISGVEGISEILSGDSIKSLSIGQEVTYNLVIINSGEKLKVYTLTPDAVEGLLITTDSIVTVPAGSSEMVPVKVKATESAKEGTYKITINVKSEDELVKSMSFTANVEKAKAVTAGNSIVVLTIILVIVFVVLLIILIALLTRKPASVETEETSYY